MAQISDGISLLAHAFVHTRDGRRRLLLGQFPVLSSSLLFCLQSDLGRGADARSDFAKVLFVVLHILTSTEAFSECRAVPAVILRVDPTHGSDHPCRVSF